ncbi:hypothetical protein B0H14DRAFT_2366798, partial [Mycena olivaceomarginata]
QSGRVLDSLVVDAETGIKSIVAGRLGTGQCDGWKSNAKAAIITTSVTVDGELYMIAAHDVSPERKTADNLLQIVLEDMKYCEEELGIIMIGYCTDNGGDACQVYSSLHNLGHGSIFFQKMMISVHTTTSLTCIF